MTNEKNKRLMRAVCSFALSFMTFLTALFTYAGFSFGWFSSNKNVGVGGAQLGVSTIDVKAEFKAFDKNGRELATEGTIAFEKLLPGDAVSLQLTLTNHTEQDLKASFSFLAPDGCETPVTVVSESGAAAYYYLGSQIRVKEMKFDGSPVTLPDGTGLETADLRLLTPADSDYTNDVRFGVKNELTAENIPLYSGAAALLPARNGGQSFPKVFSVTLNFVNAVFDQSTLKNFGGNGETCFRRLDVAYTA